MAGSVEGSIALAQMGIELLYNTLLENNFLCAVHSDEVEHKLRAIFQWLSMGTAPPISLEPLAKNLEIRLQANNGKGAVVDLPRLMVMVRNKITHPTRKNLVQLKSITVTNRYDVWCQLLRVLELCLLRIFDYNGTYANRLTQQHCGEIEPVPWANQTTTTANP
jgi:hypothetical protein